MMLDGCLSAMLKTILVVGSLALALTACSASPDGDDGSGAASADVTSTSGPTKIGTLCSRAVDGTVKKVSQDANGQCARQETGGAPETLECRDALKACQMLMCIKWNDDDSRISVKRSGRVCVSLEIKPTKLSGTERMVPCEDADHLTYPGCRAVLDQM